MKTVTVDNSNIINKEKEKEKEKDNGLNAGAGGSTISASDLNEMKNDNFPNKSRRKQKSERTSISLDI